MNIADVIDEMDGIPEPRDVASYAKYKYGITFSDGDGSDKGLQEYIIRAEARQEYVRQVVAASRLLEGEAND